MGNPWLGWGAGCGGPGTSATLEVLGDFCLQCLWQKEIRFIPDSCPTLWVQAWGTGTPRVCSAPLFVPGWGCVVLEAGGGELDFASPPKRREGGGRRSVGGQGTGAAPAPSASGLLSCRIAESKHSCSLQRAIPVVSPPLPCVQ